MFNRIADFTLIYHMGKGKSTGGLERAGWVFEILAKFHKKMEMNFRLKIIS
jgi:hypothetical protein